MGALVYLLSKGFVAIVLIAIVMLCRPAYFINNLWVGEIGLPRFGEYFKRRFGIILF